MGPCSNFLLFSSLLESLLTSSLPEEKSKNGTSFETCPKPSEKQETEQAEIDPEYKRSRARERRREGRSKTFDWAEFRPIQQVLAQERANLTETLKDTSAPYAKELGSSETDPGELERERARRREERRKRFEHLDATDGGSPEDFSRMEVDRLSGLPAAPEAKSQSVHVEIEQRWHQVETTPLREEKQIPIAPLHLPPPEENGEILHKQHLTVLLEKEVRRWGRKEGKTGGREGKKENWREGRKDDHWKLVAKSLFMGIVRRPRRPDASHFPSWNLSTLVQVGSSWVRQLSNQILKFHTPTTI